MCSRKQMPEYLEFKSHPFAYELESRASSIILALAQNNYDYEILFSCQEKLINEIISVEERIKQLRFNHEELTKEANELAIKHKDSKKRLPELIKVRVKSLQRNADGIILEIKLYQYMHWLFRYIGDSIAWRAYGFRREAIRALGGKEPIPFISDRNTTEGEINFFKAVRNLGQEWLPLMHDVTNCLRTADFSIFYQGKLIRILELKIKQSKELNPMRIESRRGDNRVGRQIDRLERIYSFLRTGDLGLLQEEFAGGKSIHSALFEKYNFGAISNAIDAARQHGYGCQEPEPGVLYFAWDIENCSETMAIKEASKKHPQVFNTVFTFRAILPRYKENHMFLPVTAMDLPAKDIIDILFSRVAVICMVNFKCLEQYCSGKGVSLQIEQHSDGSFYLRVNSKPYEGEVKEGLWDRLLLEGLSMESFTELIKSVMDDQGLYL